MTRYWSEWLPDLPATCEYKISSYGEQLRKNKKVLYEACLAKGIPVSMYALFLAMGMIETTHLTSEQRDTSKDMCAKGSANVSLFNLNIDMVKRLGFQGDMNTLNNVYNLPSVVDILQKGLKQWKVVPLLNYIRGGYTAFKDGQSYDVWNYRNTVATILKVFDMEPSLLYDDRRVEIYLKHV